MSQPEKVFRIGSVSAAVFRNRSADRREFRTVNLQRSYKDGDQTKYSNSLTLGNLPNAIAVLKMALNYVAELESSRSSG